MRSLLRALDPADVRDALALATAIVVVGASFGALAAAAGVPPLLTVALSRRLTSLFDWITGEPDGG